MNKKEIAERIKALNEYMLSETNKKLVVLKISPDYCYNKAIALIDKGDLESWYGISHKNCFKTWSEADVFLDGFCLAKNTDFDRIHER